MLAHKIDAYKAMKDADIVMDHHGGIIGEQRKDKQIALANGIMAAQAIYAGLIGIAEAIEKLNKRT